MRKYSIFFFLVMFLIGTDSFLISPLLPTLAREFQVSTALSGWMTASYTIGFAIFTLIAGPISESLDRKKVILSGLTAFTLATFLCAIAPNFAFMVAFRFLAGVSAAFVTPQVWAAIPMVARSTEERVKMLGINMAGFAGSQILGVPIGSFLAVQSWHAPFIMVAAVSVIMIIALWKILPSLQPQITGKRSFVQIYGEVLKNRQTVQFVVAFGVIFMGLFAVFSFLGTWYETAFHLQISMVGIELLFSGLGQFIGGMFGSRITQKMGNQRWAATAFFLWAILLVILPFAKNVIEAVIILAIFFGVQGMTVPVFISTIQSTAPGMSGTTSALSSFAIYTGQSIGGVFAGSMFAHFQGYFGVAYFALGAYLLAAILYAVGGFWKKAKTVQI